MLHWEIKLICVYFFQSLGLYLDTIVHSTADKLARHLGYNDPVYAAIIDAGSTGSRLLAFSFHKAYLGKY